jgi:hypothetical protein
MKMTRRWFWELLILSRTLLQRVAKQSEGRCWFYFVDFNLGYTFENVRGEFQRHEVRSFGEDSVTYYGNIVS